MARLTAEAMMAPGGILDAGSRLVQTLMEVPFERARFEEQTRMREQAELTRQQERDEDIGRQERQLRWQQDQADKQLKLGVLRDQMANRVRLADQAVGTLENARKSASGLVKALQSEEFSDEKDWILKRYADSVDAWERTIEGEISPEMRAQATEKIWREEVAPAWGIPQGVTREQFLQSDQVGLDMNAIRATLSGSIDPELADSAKNHLDAYKALAVKAREIAGIEMADAAYDDLISRLGAANEGVEVPTDEPTPKPPAEPTPEPTPPESPVADAFKKLSEPGAEDETISRGLERLSDPAKIRSASLSYVGDSVKKLHKVMEDHDLWGDLNANIRRLQSEAAAPEKRGSRQGGYQQKQRERAIEGLAKLEKLQAESAQQTEMLTAAAAVAAGVPADGVDGFLKWYASKAGQPGSRAGENVVFNAAFDAEAAAEMQNFGGGRSTGTRRSNQGRVDAAAKRDAFTSGLRDVTIDAYLNEVQEQAKIYGAYLDALMESQRLMVEESPGMIGGRGDQIAALGTEGLM